MVSGLKLLDVTARLFFRIQELHLECLILLQKLLLNGVFNITKFNTTNLEYVM